MARKGRGGLCFIFKKSKIGILQKFQWETTKQSGQLRAAAGGRAGGRPKSRFQLRPSPWGARQQQDREEGDPDSDPDDGRQRRGRRVEEGGGARAVHRGGEAASDDDDAHGSGTACPPVPHTPRNPHHA